jgi:hypothetical protein
MPTLIVLLTPWSSTCRMQVISSQCWLCHGPQNSLATPLVAAVLLQALVLLSILWHVLTRALEPGRGADHPTAVLALAQEACTLCVSAISGDLHMQPLWKPVPVPWPLRHQEGHILLLRVRQGQVQLLL